MSIFERARHLLGGLSVCMRFRDLFLFVCWPCLSPPLQPVRKTADTLPGSWRVSFFLFLVCLFLSLFVSLFVCLFFFFFFLFFFSFSFFLSFFLSSSSSCSACYCSCSLKKKEERKKRKKRKKTLFLRDFINLLICNVM